MHADELLGSTMRLFAPLPKGAQLCLLWAPVEGPGGKWQAAVWFKSPDQLCAVVIPWNGNLPVAYDVAWSDASQAADAALRFACLAAEVAPYRA